MRPIFFDNALNAELLRSGFVKLPLFRQDEAEALRSAALSLDAECKGGRFNHQRPYRLSYFSEDLALRKRIFDELSVLLMPAVDRVISEFVPLSANIFCKEPGAGEVEMHRHPSCVDESRFTSLTVHVPLVDTTRRNGTLEVIPGSHRVFGKCRSGGVPEPFADFIPALKAKHCVPVDMRFGEAVIFSDSLVHYSAANNSEHDRLTCMFVLVPREAKTIFYYWDPTNRRRLEVYGTNSNFMQRYVVSQRPEGVPCLGVVPYREEYLQEAEFAAQLASQSAWG